jgi:hypothetical protein
MPQHSQLDERELISDFRCLPPEQRAFVAAVIHSLRVQHEARPPEALPAGVIPFRRVANP